VVAQFGDLCYTDDGTTTKISDVYGFPLSNINCDTGEKVHQNGILHFLLGRSGYSYEVTGQWSSPR
jgi:hypothetical protein